MTDKLFQEAENLLQSLEDPNHPLLIAAEESGHELLLESTAQILAQAAEDIKTLKEVTAMLSSEDELDILAAMASELDWSDDPKLQKRASVLDNLLLILGDKRFGEIKATAEEELSRLREKNLPDPKSKYNHPDKKLAEIAKVISEKVKPYRSLEAPMQTRYCPDHPGEGMTRIGEGLFQCLLDKRQYDYKNGYTTLKGNKIPGGDVAEQTKMDTLIAPMVPSKTRQNP